MSLHALAAGLLLSGWAALSWTQVRHHMAAFGAVAGEARRRGWQLVGITTLMASFALCVRASGWEFGPIYWFAWLSVTALAWLLALNACARRSRWLALAAPLAGVLALAV